MKVILTVLVVIGHVCVRYKDYDDGFSKMLMKLYEIIYSFHMPAFVAISGAVYWLMKIQFKKYNNNRDFIRKKFFRLIVPYFTTAILLMLTLSLCEDISNFQQYAISNTLLCGDVRHLWFLPMLFWVFFIFNSFYRWVAYNQIITGVVLVALNLISYNISLPFQLHSSMRYAIYFWGGYIYMENKDKLKLFNNPYLIGIYAIVIITYSVYVRWSPWGNRFFDILIAALGFMCSFEISKIFPTSSSIIKLLGKHSFSIYLFHVMIIYIFLWTIDSIGLPSYYTAPIATILSVTISVLLSMSLGKLGISYLFGQK